MPIDVLKRQEKKTLAELYGKRLWIMRTLPSHAAQWLTGVFLPPHERLLLGIVFGPYRENNIIGSRGTSKSWTICSFAAPLKATLFSNITGLVLSASGFRGGKLLFEDTERLFHGELRSQKLISSFMANSASSETKKKVISRQPDLWILKMRSRSSIMTVPTNTADTMRGIRATELFIDERNTFDDDVVMKVLRPMLNVGKDFRDTATGSKDNKIFQTSTIDFSFRGWYKELQAAKILAEREFFAMKALKEGDFAEYELLMSEDDHALRYSSQILARFDYTDLILPDKVVDHEENKVYRINYPITNDITLTGITQHDIRTGESEIFTYPVEKEVLEKPLHDGTSDESIWLAEQRNVFIETAGNVYPYELIRRVAEKSIYRPGAISDYPDLDDFFAPVMHKCGDPCVMGIDYARESDQFAIVVIRLGQLAETDFDPLMVTLDDEGRPCLGKTPWNNVIWAESWSKWTAEEAAVKIFDLYQRYNIVSKINVGRGIGMDKGGGGTAVRDNLAIPKRPADADIDWVPEIVIYDPEDEDYMHFEALNSPRHRGCLELLKPQNNLNIEWTMGSKALMQQSKLYLAYWLPPSRWAADMGITNAAGSPDDSNPEYQKLIIGFNGVRKLKEQLLRIQTKVSEAGTIRYMVPGDRTKEEGKKDLYSAYIYACKMARDHLVGLTKKDKAAPTAIPVIVEIGRQKGNNRGWRRLGWG